MYKKTFFALMAAVIVFTSTHASAQQRRDIGAIYLECGIGALIFQQQRFGALAAISNIIWDLGTTAISSEVSSPESCKGGEASTAVLIHEALPQLEQDIAKGSGDYLHALLTMAGCPAESQPAMTGALRKAYAATAAAENFADSDREDRGQALFSALVGNATAASCTLS